MAAVGRLGRKLERFAHAPKSIMKTLFALICALALHTSSTRNDAIAAEADAEVVHSFKMTLVSRVTMEIEGKKQPMTANTEVRYRWRRKEREHSLSIESVFMRADLDGREMMNAFMSRAKFIGVKLGRTNEIATESAPNGLKKILQDSFGVPLCVLQVDEQLTMDVANHMVTQEKAVGSTQGTIVASFERLSANQ
jgi:hypothetical protein